jgi:hypothetical protein
MNGLSCSIQFNGSQNEISALGCGENPPVRLGSGLERKAGNGLNAI